MGLTCKQCLTQICRPPGCVHTPGSRTHLLGTVCGSICEVSHDILHGFRIFYIYFHIDGLSLLNEDGGLRVFFPRNSFVTNTTLTHTNSPRMDGGATGNNHIVCYGGNLKASQVPWRNSSGGRLSACATPCRDCGYRCVGNGAVGVDPPLAGHTDIHIYTNSSGYVNQDLECRVSGSKSAFIGVYLKDGGEYRCFNSCTSSQQQHSLNVMYGICSSYLKLLLTVYSH